MSTSLMDAESGESYAVVNERTLEYVNTQIDARQSNVLNKAAIDTNTLPHFEKLYEGKVRDMYICRDVVVIVTTDRQSAFDRQLAEVPFKGRVLNLLALWWFEQSHPLIPNHVIASPHPNVTVGRRCDVFMVEFVMRAYITGSTSTSMWTNYAKGVRLYCGHALPDNLVKNQQLSSPLLTPTTKSDEHDELISGEEVVAKGLMIAEDWSRCSELAHKLFALGQEKAASRGLILVDTKYEFGRDRRTGEICVLDEVHTPDSSRYWLQESYRDRFHRGEEPENIDKEFLRRWYTAHCDPYKDATLPTAPAELVNELSRRYILVYEVLTGQRFPFPENGEEDLAQAVASYFREH